MNNILYLDPRESAHAASLKAGESMVFVRPWKEQPKKGLYDGCDINRIVDIIMIFNHDRGIMWESKLRYPVGKYAGKEVWCWEFPSLKHGSVLYKSDGIKLYYPCQKWQSPITMPADAVRSRFEVVSNRVDKAKTATPDEMKLMGIAYPMCNGDVYYNRLTAKCGKDAWDSYAEIATGRKL